MLGTKIRPSAVNRLSYLATNRRNYSSNGDIVLTKIHDGECSGIAELALNRDMRYLNALDSSLTSSVIANLAKLKNNKDITAVIIKSNSIKAFCAGMDVKEAASPSNNGKLEKLGFDMIWAIHHFPKPTISAVDGLAMGGGLETAMACDIAIAGDNVRAGLPESSLGIIPGGSGHYLSTKLVGPNKAKELVFTSSVLNAKQCYEIGLFQHLVEQNKDNNAAYLKAMELAKMICQNGPIAHEKSKLLIDRNQHLDFITAFDMEWLAYSSLQATSDAKEGIKAFAERRKPIFKNE